MSDALRLFVAFPLDGGALAALAGADRFLQGLGSFRRTPDALRHVTIAFLGEVPAGRIDAVREAIARCAEGLAPGAFEVGRIEAIPNARRARVIAAALRGDEAALAAMREVGRAAMHAAGRTGERTEPRPHVTLARVRGRNPVRVDLADAPVLRGRLGAGAVEVVHSRLTAEGPIYSVLAAIPLRG